MPTALETYVAEMNALANRPACLLLMPMGFEPESLGGGCTGLVRPLAAGGRMVVLTAHGDSAPESPDEAVELHVVDDDGCDLTRPVHYDSVWALRHDAARGALDDLAPLSGALH